jgi:hypothetical protein
MKRALELSKKYARKNLLLIIAILIVLALAATYELGFRLGPGVTLERVSSLTLTNVPTGASIYVDQTFRTTTTATSSVKEELLSGSHAIIVSVPGDYPWNTMISMISGKNVSISPIFISMEPNVTPLSGTDKTNAIAAIASSTLPTFGNPIKLMNGCELLYVSNNQVIADAATTTPLCTPPPYLCTGTSCGPTIIFSPVTPLTLVKQFPGRQDALVVQLGTILYAIAVDPRSPQFFAPILTGTQPVAGALSNGTIVVQNGTAVYKVNL